MKNLVIALLVTLSAVFSANAQRAQSDSIRLYRFGDYFVKDNSGGTKPEVLPLSAVEVKKNSSSIQVRIDGVAYLYSPAQFLDKTGTAYSSTNSFLAVKAFRDRLPGNVGSVASTVTSYTSGTTTVTTTGSFKIYIKNAGGSAATYTYGGQTFPIAAGATETIDADRDLGSGLYAPFLPLTIIPGSSTVNVLQIKKQ